MKYNCCDARTADRRTLGPPANPEDASRYRYTHAACEAQTGARTMSHARAGITLKRLSQLQYTSPPFHVGVFLPSFAAPSRDLPRPRACVTPFPPWHTPPTVSGARGPSPHTHAMRIRPHGARSVAMLAAAVDRRSRPLSRHSCSALHASRLHRAVPASIKPRAAWIVAACDAATLHAAVVVCRLALPEVPAIPPHHFARGPDLGAVRDAYRADERGGAYGCVL